MTNLYLLACLDTNPPACETDKTILEKKKNL